MANYIQSIRGKVGHMPIILNACAGVLFDDQGRILLQERTDTNNWSLPGGYMEYGENFEQTIIREYKEDSGLEIKPVKQLAVFDQGFTEYPNGDVCQVISVLFEVERWVVGESLNANLKLLAPIFLIVTTFHHY